MRRSALWGACVVAVLLVSGCGTRAERRNAASAGNPAGTAQAALADVAGSPGTADAAPPAAGNVTDSTAPAGSGSAPVAGVRPGSGSGNASSAQRDAGRPAGTNAGASATPAGSSSAGGPARDRNDGASAPAPGGSGSPSAPGAPATPGVPSGPGGNSPVPIGHVGTLSGPAASTLKPVLDGAQLWVTATNARGGLNGHPIRFLVYDDGGDPARHRAQVQDAIERHHVVAFLANTEQITGQPSVKYVTDKRVPIIGTAGGVDWAYTSPMYFPASSESHAMARTFVLSITSQIPDKHKLGILYCAEASGCQQAADISEKTVKETDYEVVYKGKASIAQPDFTAECLAARNAGTEVLYINMDSNSIGRVAASCARQGFKPRYGAVVTTLVDRFKDDPNLEGLVGPSQIFPYFQTGTPAADEYQKALSSYGKGLINGVAMAAGWTAGKLLEAATVRLPEPPTNVAVLEGLYALRGNDLGGITQPLTFVRDQPAPARSCWFNIGIASGRWRTPDNYKLHCA